MNNNHSPIFEERFRKVLLETFQESIAFLNAHNLRWWAAFGTMLGAVRHQGLIPWDDDIDIYMPREDYNKLIALRSEMEHTNLDINTYHDKGYIYPFAKILNKHTTLWEMKEYPHITGVYIDIFPIDQTDAGKEEIIQTQRKFKHAARRMMLYHCKQNLSGWMDTLLERGFPYAIDAVIAKVKQKRTVKEFQQMEDSLLQPNGKTWVRYCRRRRHDVYDKSWFESYTDMPFEDFTVRVPCGYHEILTQEYGDYMTPPPEDKRASIHHRYYINLKERLTMDEVLRRTDRGERIVF